MDQLSLIRPHLRVATCNLYWVINAQDLAREWPAIHARLRMDLDDVPFASIDSYWAERGEQHPYMELINSLPFGNWPDLSFSSDHIEQAEQSEMVFYGELIAPIDVRAASLSRVDRLCYDMSLHLTVLDSHNLTGDAFDFDVSAQCAFRGLTCGVNVLVSEGRFDARAVAQKVRGLLRSDQFSYEYNEESQTLLFMPSASDDCFP